MILHLLTFVHVCVCIMLIALILMQRGRGADIGAAMGAGASQTLFGSQGSANFLSRSTAWLAVAFFILCLVMTALTYRQSRAHDLGHVSFPTPETVDPAMLPE